MTDTPKTAEQMKDEVVTALSRSGHTIYDRVMREAVRIVRAIPFAEPDVQVRELEAVAASAQDLLSRMSAWEADNLTDENFRDWNGHVEPAKAKLIAALNAASRSA